MKLCGSLADGSVIKYQKGPEIMDVSTKNPPGGYHRQAAAQHQAAAHHHNQAAYYHDLGQFEDARQHAVAAKEHCELAYITTAYGALTAKPDQIGFKVAEQDTLRPN